MKRSITYALVACFTLAWTATGYAQTNDPLISKQQYLFDYHNVDQAWNLTTGSPAVRIGLYSMLGFRQLHEDLAGARIQNPVGSLLQPEHDYASEMIGIIGATKNNAVGMAGIDQQARLQSYSVLRSAQPGDDPENVIEFEVDGTTHSYYLDVSEFENRINTARSAGVDVHVFSFGLPTGREVDYLGDPITDVSVPLPQVTVPSVNPLVQFYNIVRRRIPEIIGGLCLSNCWTPPDPIRNFRAAIGNLVMFEQQVAIAPVGDLEDPADPHHEFMPAMMNQYVTGVGGVVKDDFDNFIKWPRSIEAPYVDVVAAAENVVGLSGTGFSAYNEEFGGTSAAAAIAAATASLMKAENSDLSSEDVRAILNRTAISVGGSGHNHATGHGVVDAGAAVSYVRNKDILRLTASSSDIAVISDEAVPGMTNIVLAGYQEYSPQVGCTEARGDLRKFELRVSFSEFSTVSTPDVWIRWAQSDGVDTALNPATLKNHNDAFVKSLEVKSIDPNGFNVEGYYWYSRWSTTAGQQCPTQVEIPTAPALFSIAYTVAGDLGPPPPPPLTASLTGDQFLTANQTGNWTATTSGGQGSTWIFKWYTCDNGFSCTLRRNVNKAVNNDSFSYAWSGTGDHRVDVEVTRGVETAWDNLWVHVSSGSCEPWEPCRIAHPGVDGVADAIPDDYILQGNYPNPFNPSTEIRFGLPETAEVTLTVYDVTGKEVARLVNGSLSAGYHRVTWDASGLPSSIYLYHLTANDFAESGRMALVK